MKVPLLLLCMIRSSFTSSLANSGVYKNLIPNHISSITQSKLTNIARISTTAGLTALSSSISASNSPTPSTNTNNNVEEKTPTKFSSNRFTTIGNDMPVCRLLNGMWQVSGAHGFDPDKEKAVADMARYADEGFTTFDLADIYGPAEDYVGAFRKGPVASSSAKNCQFFTKWVPRPEAITKQMAQEAINRSIKRMRIESNGLDLLQFHWWDYSNEYYYDAMAHLMDMHEQGIIKNIGLTNFDTTHLVKLINQDAPIVSNQVSFSILDTRPLEKMIPVCLEKNIKLLCYGSLLGGFISESWLGRSEPSINSLTNVSLRKYLPWIFYWGGWELFQQLLLVLRDIGIKHNVSLSSIALRWVIDQPAVGGAIVGARLGYKQHIKDNLKVFDIQLDEDDYNKIKNIQMKSKQNLMQVFGDCGDEYRRRPKV